MRERRDDGETEDESASADDGETEEGGSSHASFGVVEETVDPGVGELGGVVVEEKEVRVEPAYARKEKGASSAKVEENERQREKRTRERTEVAEDLVGRGSSPEVKSDEGLRDVEGGGVGQGECTRTRQESCGTHETKDVSKELASDGPVRRNRVGLPGESDERGVGHAKRDIVEDLPIAKRLFDGSLFSRGVVVVLDEVSDEPLGLGLLLEEETQSERVE